MRQKSSSGKWRSRQNLASGGKGSKGSGGKELRCTTYGTCITFLYICTCTSHNLQSTLLLYSGYDQ